jgi:cytochrome b6-f complex iron-sulfur subunit
VAEGRLLLPLTVLDQGGQAFLQAPGMPRPIYVRRLDSGEISAVLASCTHQGCQPEPVADRLACPCHGSEFGFDGRVLQGPAERPLTRYEVAVEGPDLVVFVEARGAA